MHWLDGTLSVPTIGITTKPDLKIASKYLQLLAPVIEKHFARGGGKVTQETAFGVTVEFSSGFACKLEPESMFVRFAYPHQVERHPGAFPSLQLANLAKYSDLLTQARDLLLEFLSAAYGAKPIPLTRVGVVAQLEVDAGAPPPGVEALMNHLAGPWGKPLVKVEMPSLLVNLEEGDRSIDRCHHGLWLDSTNAEQGLRLRLDWQRLFLLEEDARSLADAATLGACVESALKYFEIFGLGDLDYDK